MFYGLDKEFEYSAIADSALAREQELFYYNLNIDNYNHALANLPTHAWPSELVEYKNIEYSTLPIDILEQVGVLQYRDQLLALVKTNTIERNKCQLIYNALIAKLPVEIRDTYMKQAFERHQNASVKVQN